MEYSEKAGQMSEMAAGEKLVCLSSFNYPCKNGQESSSSTAPINWISRPEVDVTEYAHSAAPKG